MSNRLWPQLAHFFPRTVQAQVHQRQVYFRLRSLRGQAPGGDEAAGAREFARELGTRLEGSRRRLAGGFGVSSSSASRGVGG